MQIDKSITFLFALTALFLVGLAVAPITSAQSLDNHDPPYPTVCYQITSLPNAGTITTAEDPPAGVGAGDFFTKPPRLIYRAPATGGIYTLDYSVYSLAHAHTGSGFCFANPTLACQLGSTTCQNNSANDFCVEVITDTCQDQTSALDSATVSFNISDADPCPAFGRNLDCNPDDY